MNYYYLEPIQLGKVLTLKVSGEPPPNYRALKFNLH